MAPRWHFGYWLLMAPLLLNAATGPWLIARGDALDGAMLTGFCVLAGSIVWTAKATGSWLFWLIPLNFAGITAVMATGDIGLAGYYAAVTLLCAAGAFLGTSARPPSTPIVGEAAS